MVQEGPERIVQRDRDADLIGRMSDLLDTAMLVFKENCNTPESRVVRGAWCDLKKEASENLNAKLLPE